MNRQLLHALADGRAAEAQALINAGLWSGAYYLARYAVECGLKACILRHVEATGIIFLERDFSRDCWTHDLEKLLLLAGLKAVLGTDLKFNPGLLRHWNRVIS